MTDSTTTLQLIPSSRRTLSSQELFARTLFTTRRCHSHSRHVHDRSPFAATPQALQHAVPCPELCRGGPDRCHRRNCTARTKPAALLPRPRSVFFFFLVHTPPPPRAENEPFGQRCWPLRWALDGPRYSVINSTSVYETRYCEYCLPTSSSRHRLRSVLTDTACPAQTKSRSGPAPPSQARTSRRRKMKGYVRRACVRPRLKRGVHIHRHGCFPPVPPPL